MHKRTRPAQRKFPDKNRRRWHVAWLPGWIMHRSSATLTLITHRSRSHVHRYTPPHPGLMAGVDDEAQCALQS
jgi:hypothetical protein